MYTLLLTTEQLLAFAFERFNGILGQLPNNNKLIEVQMMKCFLSDTEIMKISLSVEFMKEFHDLMNSQRNNVGTL